MKAHSVAHSVLRWTFLSCIRASGSLACCQISLKGLYASGGCMGEPGLSQGSRFPCGGARAHAWNGHGTLTASQCALPDCPSTKWSPPIAS